jgi:hypothetical protein
MRRALDTAHNRHHLVAMDDEVGRSSELYGDDSLSGGSPSHQPTYSDTQSCGLAPLFSITRHIVNDGQQGPIEILALVACQAA